MVSVSYLKSVHKYPKLPSCTSLCRHGSLPYSYTMAKAPLMKKDEKIHYTKRMVSLQFRKGWYSMLFRDHTSSQLGFFHLGKTSRKYARQRDAGFESTSLKKSNDPLLQLIPYLEYLRSLLLRRFPDMFVQVLFGKCRVSLLPAVITSTLHVFKASIEKM